MSDQHAALIEAAAQIINEGYALPPVGSGKRAKIVVSPIDIVSPLTVPEARRLLFAKAVGSWLRQLGYEVQCHGLLADYDASVKKFTVSIWLRYLELCGEAVAYREDCYQGDYIFDFAATVHRTYGSQWRVAANEVASLLTQADSCDEAFKQIRARLGNEALSTIQQIGLHSIHQDIVNDLQEIGVVVDEWPRASDVIHNGTVADAIHRFEVNDFVHTDNGSRYVSLPVVDEEANDLLIENQTGPTPMAVQFSYFLSVFGSDRARSDLNICVCDIDEVEAMTLFNRCAALPGNAGAPMVVAPMIVKPISCPQLFELGELVHTSPLAEDFVSFRETRQTIGMDYLQWMFGLHPSGEAVTIDLTGNTERVSCRECASVVHDMLSRSVGCDTNRLATALSELNPNQRKHAESFLETITEFHDAVNQTTLLLEPALMVKYYRNLCERFLSYYNNHQLMAHVPKPNACNRGKHHDEQTRAEYIVSVMTSALQRLQHLIDSLIFTTHATQHNKEL